MTVLLLSLAILAQQPDFYDPPSFVVAGVTDASARGGHGSDAILTSAENLTRQMATLGPKTSEADPLAAVRNLQLAAEKNPSEANLFALASELLQHRAATQAAEVFSRAAVRYPKSARILLGLAVAHYLHGDFDKAQPAFFAAADIKPQDPTPYLFLGETLNSPVGKSEGTASRMRRFARLHPKNAWANYYCAMTHTDEAEPLLQSALKIDANFFSAWLQLGNITAEHDIAKAVTFWEQAEKGPENDPDVIEAHYRLAQAYKKLARIADAKQELERFNELSKKLSEEKEQQRSHIQEFVFKLRDNH